MARRRSRTTTGGSCDQRVTWASGCATRLLVRRAKDVVAVMRPSVAYESTGRNERLGADCWHRFEDARAARELGSLDAPIHSAWGCSRRPAGDWERAEALAADVNAKESHPAPTGTHTKASSTISRPAQTPDSTTQAPPRWARTTWTWSTRRYGCAGVENLGVIDASIRPTMVSGNINAAGDAVAPARPGHRRR